MRFQSIFLILVAFILAVNGAAERKNPNGPPPGFKPRPAPKPLKTQSGNATKKIANLRNENLAIKILKKLTPIEAATKLFGNRPTDSMEKVQKRIKNLEKVSGLIAEYKKLIKEEKAEKNTWENKKLTIGKAEKSSVTKIEPLSAVEKEKFEMMAAEIANAKAERAKNNPNGIDVSKHKSIGQLNAHLQDYMIDGDIVPTVKEMEEKVNQLRAAAAGGNRGVETVIRAKRAGAFNFEKYPDRRWDITKPIAYFIDANLTTTRVNCIETAIEFYYNTTCYEFQKLTAIPNDSTPYIHFTGYDDEGCWSEGVGYNSEPGDPEHIVNFGKEWCGTLDICEHEIGHRLGLFHTQNRIDRDDYINMNLTNTNAPYQFRKETPDRNNNFNVTYEYGSMMHYGGFDRAIDESIPVIRTKDPLYQNTIGQFMGATFADVLMMNRAFGCNKCPVGNGTAACKNGGYPKPKLCSECLCPPGWDGILCEQRKAASSVNANCTGATLTATTKWQLLEGSVSFPRNGPDPIWEYGKGESCHWHIKAPSPEMWIDLWIEEVATSTDQTCFRQCSEAFTEFKVANFTHTGAQMCCQSQLGSEGYVVMTAKEGFAMITAQSKWGTKAFRVWYVAY